MRQSIGRRRAPRSSYEQDRQLDETPAVHWLREFDLHGSSEKNCRSQAMTRPYRSSQRPLMIRRTRISFLSVIETTRMSFSHFWTHPFLEYERKQIGMCCVFECIVVLRVIDDCGCVFLFLTEWMNVTKLVTLRLRSGGHVVRYWVKNKW